MSSFTAKRLREARMKAGYTQDEAATYMKLKKTTISEMEAGKRSVSSDELAQFSRIYEVDVRELSDRDVEDVYWILKQRVNGLI